MFNLFSKSKAEKELEDLMASYQEPVYWFVRRRVGNHDDAADITQEVFIRVYRSLDSLKDRNAAKSWIFRIAVNEIARYMEQQKKQHGEITPEIENQVADGEYVDYDEAMSQKFQKALLRLSDRQREVFDLRYYQEMAYEEIAEVLGSSVSTMKTTYHIAKQKITDYILNED